MHSRFLIQSPPGALSPPPFSHDQWRPHLTPTTATTRCPIPMSCVCGFDVGLCPVVLDCVMAWIDLVIFACTFTYTAVAELPQARAPPEPSRVPLPSFAHIVKAPSDRTASHRIAWNPLETRIRSLCFLCLSEVASLSFLVW